MNQELEALLKSWDFFVNAAPSEANRLLKLYETQLQETALARKVPSEMLHRMVRRSYQRWQWADDPKFPRDLRKIGLD